MKEAALKAAGKAMVGKKLQKGKADPKARKEPKKRKADGEAWKEPKKRKAAGKAGKVDVELKSQEGAPH